MLVGSSATGKTSAVKCLVLALELQQAAAAALAAPLINGRNETNGEVDLGNGPSMVPEYAYCTNETAKQSHCGCKAVRPRCIAHRIFPKALVVEELYGSLDPTTREWRGGALEQAVREASLERDSNVRRWIILDGPVDVVRYTQAGNN